MIARGKTRCPILVPTPQSQAAQVIDYFALALIHGLLAVMMIRLSSRPDLDREPTAPGEDQGGA